MTLDRKTIQAARVRLSKTVSAHCIVRPLPRTKSLSLYVFPFCPPPPTPTPPFLLPITMLLSVPVFCVCLLVHPFTFHPVSQTLLTTVCSVCCASVSALFRGLFWSLDSTRHWDYMVTGNKGKKKQIEVHQTKKRLPRKTNHQQNE